MADALTNTTTLATALPVLVGQRAVYYYEKHRLFGGLIGPNYTYKLNKGESAIDISQLDTMTFAARTEATAQDSDAFTTTKRTFTPVTHGENVVVSIEALDRSGPNVVDWMAEAAATAWAYQEDTVATYSFPAQYGEACNTAPDHEIGTDSVALTAKTLRDGVALLLAAGAKGPYHYVIDPIQFGELMADAEAKQFLWGTPTNGTGYAATLGVSPERYLGQIYGAHVWVGDAMIESSGLHSIMFGQGAFGKAYRILDTPTSVSGGNELLVDMQWHNDLLAYRIVYAVCQHITGAAFTSTTNKFCVDIIS